MLNNSEWEEIKIDLISLYNKKNNSSSEEIENQLLKLLVNNTKVEKLDEKLPAIQIKYILSDREIEVIKKLIDGRTNLEISESLAISISTVKKHIYNIFNKTGVSSRTQLLNLVYNIQLD